MNIYMYICKQNTIIIPFENRDQNHKILNLDQDETF